jgi:phosphatidate cytidylyltransferase
LISAAVIISVLLGLIAVDFQMGDDGWFGRPGLVLGLIAIAVAMLSAQELVHLFQKFLPSGRTTEAVLIAGISVTICSLPILWRDYPADCPIGILGWSMLALTFAAGSTLLLEILRFDDSGQSTNRVGLSVLIYAQLILLFGFLVAHTLLTTVKMSDAAAYFAGKSLGRNKLAPQLSPGKTVEGLIGSVFGALLGCIIVVHLVAPYIFKSQLNISWIWIVIYSIAVTLAGVVGDLSESMFKRDAKIKDSSSWLPGLGGVLDITDSLVFAAPVSWFLWVLTR